MKRAKSILFVLFAVVALSAWSLAQEQRAPAPAAERERGPVDVAPSRDMGPSDLGSRGGGGRLDVPSFPGGPGSVTIATPPSGNTASRVPIQTYAPYSYFDPYGFYRCDIFLYRLYQQYGLSFRSDYLWRYAQGDSALTPELIRLALQDSSKAAGSLVEMTGDLQKLLVDYEAGGLDRKTFQKQFDATLSAVRKFSKKIRGDYYLEYIDQRPEIKMNSGKEVAVASELRTLVNELHAMSLRIHKGISNLYHEDMARVVAVEHLNQPSFKSISKGIERLSKVIEKSVDRL